MYKTLPLLLVIASLFSLEINAQDYLMDGSPITDCQGSFYDSGGRTADYSPGEDFSTLICPDWTTGTKIKLDFFDLDLGSGDELTVYDGITADADLLLRSFDHTSKPPFSLQSTVINTTGCLLVRFQSDEEEEGRGWRDRIQCTVSCQLIRNEAITDPVAESGFVDICVGESVEFVANPIFLQNGLVYEQSLENCTYSWLFSDRERYSDQVINRAFEQPGSYWVRLAVEDPLGCVNTEFLDIEIRVSPGLSYEVSKLSKNAYCWGDTVAIQTIVGELPEETLGVGMLPVTITQVHQQTESFTEIIPDGNASVYKRQLIVNGYPDGFTFEELEDFQGIYLNLEHSYSGDLDIEVTCPDGITVSLLDNSDGTGSVNLGEPYLEEIFSGTLPGVGFDYFFSDGAENGTLGEFDAPICGEGTGCNWPFPYTYHCFPAGTYAPSTPLVSLATCSMNGEWTLRIKDQITSDNGWVFGWGLGTSSTPEPIIADTIAVEHYAWDNDPALLW
ncbi:MAG: PKD domain-containing protein [Bacteroidota bacterium]